jgi:hypothetical protein
MKNTDIEKFGFELWGAGSQTYLLKDETSKMKTIPFEK